MNRLKRTKIICTIGPASASAQKLEAMIRAGMNVARLNMSHGTYASHRAMIKTIRSVSDKLGEPVALLADLQGPKIRLGVLPEKGVELKTGASIKFISPPFQGGARGGWDALPVTFAIHKDVKVGHRILIEDGIYELKVTKVKGREVMARVVSGGVVTSHKGMNFPDSTLAVDPITKKDREDAKFAVRQGAHWIAMSFVTSPGDVSRMRRIIRSAVGARLAVPKIIVKIEKHEALKKFDQILKVADAVMVARGDLGVETPAEDVPLRQKEMIIKCRAAGKPVVVATQMLDSMIRNPRPTRAEVSDVANAVIDHADAVMLSGETATGKYPVEAVRVMGKICLDTEASAFDDVKINSFEHKMSSNELISASLGVLSRINQIDAIVAATPILSAAAISPLLSKEGQGVVGLLNKFRPEVPIYLACQNDFEARQWNIAWGLRPIVGSIPSILKMLKGKTVAIVSQGKGQDPEIELREL